MRPDRMTGALAAQHSDILDECTRDLEGRGPGRADGHLAPPARRSPLRTFAPLFGVRAALFRRPEGAAKEAGFGEGVLSLKLTALPHRR